MVLYFRMYIRKAWLGKKFACTFGSLGESFMERERLVGD